MIRQANKHDIIELVEMMRLYAQEAPIEILKKIQDEDHVKSLLISIISGRGFILVDDQYKGMIVGLITHNVWSPKVLELHELAWWVRPEHRNTSVGGKLWLEFNRIATELLNIDRVQIICTSKMVTSPALDYEKRGFKELETTYFRE